MESCSIATSFIGGDAGKCNVDRVLKLLDAFPSLRRSSRAAKSQRGPDRGLRSIAGMALALHIARQKLRSSTANALDIAHELNGRPFIAHESKDRSLARAHRVDLSISHHGGWAAASVATGDCGCGIDLLHWKEVPSSSRQRSYFASYFGAKEWDALELLANKLDPDIYCSTFAVMWTVKEACVKVCMMYAINCMRRSSMPLKELSDRRYRCCVHCVQARGGGGVNKEPFTSLSLDDTSLQRLVAWVTAENGSIERQPLRLTLSGSCEDAPYWWVPPPPFEPRRSPPSDVILVITASPKLSSFLLSACFLLFRSLFTWMLDAEHVATVAHLARPGLAQDQHSASAELSSPAITVVSLEELMMPA